MLAGHWTLPVLAELSKLVAATRSYTDGITYKILTDTLRRAERDGLITRHLDPYRIETATLYELTDLDRSLNSLGGYGRVGGPQLAVGRNGSTTLAASLVF